MKGKWGLFFVSCACMGSVFSSSSATAATVVTMTIDVSNDMSIAIPDNFRHIQAVMTSNRFSFNSQLYIINRTDHLINIQARIMSEDPFLDQMGMSVKMDPAEDRGTAHGTSMGVQVMGDTPTTVLSAMPPVTGTSIANYQVMIEFPASTEVRTSVITLEFIAMTP